MCLNLITVGPKTAMAVCEYSLALLSFAPRNFVNPAILRSKIRHCRIVLLISCLLACWGVPAAAAETSTTRLRRQARELLRQEAIAAAGVSKDAAVAALCDMYVILRNDSRYFSSDMLREDAMQVRRRLIGVARKRVGQLRRDGVVRPSGLSADVESAIESALDRENDQRGQPLALGGGAIQDEGWRLVELIQRVVAPDFWENRGGPGAIRYFAIRRVLVVRATTDVHEQIKDLLMALR
jgi:hypothetical protein